MIAPSPVVKVRDHIFSVLDKEIINNYLILNFEGFTMNIRLLCLTFLLAVSHYNLKASQVPKSERVMSITRANKDVAENVSIRLATQDNVPAILAFLATAGVPEQNKIVVLPEGSADNKHRENYTKGNVAKGRFAIATLSGEVVAQKRAFLFQDDNERDGVIKDEFRIKEEGLKQSGSVSMGNGQLVASSARVHSVDFQSILHRPFTSMYLGGDLTQLDCRGQGINNALGQFACEAMVPAAVADIAARKSEHIAAFIGVTDSNNVGQGLLKGRVTGQARTFAAFATNVAMQAGMHAPSTMSVVECLAYKPSFNQELKEAECNPLPDSQSIAGSGYMLVCSLEKQPTK